MDWSASNYLQRKSQRLAEIKPEWFTNPDTGEKFYLRNNRALMSSVIAGNLPSALTSEAIKAWQEKGVDGLDTADAEKIAEKMSTAEIEASARNMQRLSRIIQEACVIPLLSNEPPESIKFDPEWRAAAIAGLIEQDPKFDPASFDPKNLVLDPRELDESDSQWLLFKWASGLVGTVNLKGGVATDVANIKRLRKKPGRRVRAGNRGKDVRKAS